MAKIESGIQSSVIGSRDSGRVKSALPLFGLYLIRKGFSRHRSLLTRLLLFYAGGRLIRSGWQMSRESFPRYSQSSESFQINREIELNGDADKLFTHINQPEFIQSILDANEWPQLTPAMSETDNRRWLRVTTKNGVEAEVEFAHETEGPSLCWKCIEPERFAHTGTLEALPSDHEGKVRLRLNLIFTEMDGGPRFRRYELRSLDRFVSNCLRRLKQAYESEAFSMATRSAAPTTNPDQTAFSSFRV